LHLPIGAMVFAGRGAATRRHWVPGRFHIDMQTYFFLYLST
jgi:hypothetical protein